eukprot:jgi/Mesvir1/28924/Mv18006-RA.1
MGVAACITFRAVWIISRFGYVPDQAMADARDLLLAHVDALEAGGCLLANNTEGRNGTRDMAHASDVHARGDVRKQRFGAGGGGASARVEELEHIVEALEGELAELRERHMAACEDASARLRAESMGHDADVARERSAYEALRRENEELRAELAHALASVTGAEDANHALMDRVRAAEDELAMLQRRFDREGGRCDDDPADDAMCEREASKDDWDNYPADSRGAIPGSSRHGRSTDHGHDQGGSAAATRRANGACCQPSAYPSAGRNRNADGHSEDACERGRARSSVPSHRVSNSHPYPALSCTLNGQPAGSHAPTAMLTYSRGHEPPPMARKPHKPKFYASRVMSAVVQGPRVSSRDCTGVPGTATARVARSSAHGTMGCATTTPKYKTKAVRSVKRKAQVVRAGRGTDRVDLGLHVAWDDEGRLHAHGSTHGCMAPAHAHVHTMPPQVYAHALPPQAHTGNFVQANADPPARPRWEPLHRDGREDGRALAGCAGPDADRGAGRGQRGEGHVQGTVCGGDDSCQDPYCCCFGCGTVPGCASAR